jgi:hypothetical protein
MSCSGSSEAAMKRKHIRLTVLASAVLLGACAGGNPEAPSYRAGFSDGCASATAHEPVRDAGLYAQDEDYRAGWLSGRNSCAPPPVIGP